MASPIGELLGWIESKGRVGGAVAVALGAGCVIGGIVLWRTFVPEDAGFWSPKGVAISLGLDGLGFALILVGARQLRSRFQPAPRAVTATAGDRARVASEMDGRVPPYFVCVRCARIHGTDVCLGTCPDCGTTAECLEVRVPHDVPLVRAALE